MKMKPKVCVLRTDGTNCDKELAMAFNLAGAEAEIVTFNTLKKEYDPVTQRKVRLTEDYQIFAIPGGFSFGDYIRAGTIQAYQMQRYLGDQIAEFIESGKPVIGICNGFQVLAQTGFTPALDAKIEQSAALAQNEGKTFRCKWVYLSSPAENESLWTEGIEGFWIPIAHGEGRFVAPEETLSRIESKNLVAFRYDNPVDNIGPDYEKNPNGSMNDIAGITNEAGNVIGLMPHPERYTHPHNHPLATLQKILDREYVDTSDPVIQQRMDMAGPYLEEGAGLQMFKNAVTHAERFM